MKHKGRSGYIHTYGVQHHERAQRVTHSLEALDEGSGTEMRAEGPPAPLLTGDESTAFRFFFPPCSASTFSSNVEALLSHPCYYYLSIPFHARHWLWIRLGLKAAVGQTITRTTDEANLFIRRWLRK